MTLISQYYKAIAAAILAFLGTLIIGLDDNSLTSSEWLYAVALAISAGTGVAFAPRNKYPDQNKNQ